MFRDYKMRNRRTKYNQKIHNDKERILNVYIFITVNNITTINTQCFKCEFTLR